MKNKYTSSSSICSYCLSDCFGHYVWCKRVKENDEKQRVITHYGSKISKANHGKLVKHSPFEIL